ncbi:ferrous iron transporter A [Erwinia sp. S63]|uniref:ferrous iron transporter A n=1 Tax=Erwinia sp. S63 TaxID=2769341 RepID=UPI00190AD875|nr:ferrous iron transporter A [Erwinia sp. S63]MBK0097494.1 ferrous iron transporter A [Erwinia sp. S63]
MHVRPQHTYRIMGFKSHINPAWRQKLLAIGLLPGSTLEVVRVAPLGDPIQIRIRRVSFAVRQTDLANINLENVSV